MGSAPERAPAEWFRAAMHSYVVNHQGCPYCHGQHCVFRSFWGKRIEYFCSTCEFSVCLDAQTNTFRATSGDKKNIALSVLDATLEPAAP